MPRYYFHIREGGKVMQDGDGADFPDLGAARKEAVYTARCMIDDLREVGAPLDGQRIEICDEEGVQVDVVPIREGLRD